MKIKLLISTLLLSLSISTSIIHAEATTQDKITYTLSDDGTYYIVTGCTEDIVTANIAAEINGTAVTTLKAGAFSKNTTLREVIIPSSITQIENSIFQNCNLLEKVTFKPGDKGLVMGGWVFNNCTSLKEISIPARLSQMSANSNFNGCKSLDKVVFESGNTKLKEIPQYTFANTAITELDLSGLEALYTFYPNILQNVSSTKMRVVMSPSQTLQYLPQKMFTNVNATEIIYPEGTTSIVRNAFNGYTKVQSVLLPATLETIEPKAFMNCSCIELISVPESVKTIGESAFGYESGKNGPGKVILNQKGGQWPAQTAIAGTETKVYCYKNISGIPDGIITVAPIETARYTTYFSSTAVSLPEDVTAGVVTGISGGELTLYYSFQSGDILPASTPVLLKSNITGVTLYPRIIPDEESVYSGINYLKGSESEASFETSNINYILKETNGKYSFEKTDNTTTENLPNCSYLSLPSSLAGDYVSFPLDGTVTGIDNIISDKSNDNTLLFNLQGVKVDRNNLTPGIYVSNGKKIILK